ncbi:MAG: hypothetical protein ABTQ32_06270 [Myxococcaceae bacterium]
MNDYEFASAYVESIVRGLRRTGHQDEILSKVSVPAQTLWKDPFGETWQPAKLLEEIGEVAVAIMGEQAFDNLTYGAMKERFGPIVLPMIKSSLAKQNPGAVLRKLNDLVKVAIRGAEIMFQPEGTTGGILQVSYPRPVAAHVVKSWLGVLRFVFEVSAPGEVKETFHAPHGATLQYRVAWKEPASS